MQIEDLKIFPLSIPLRKAFKIALGTSYTYRGVLLKLETSTYDGWGEAAPSRRITGETQSTVLRDLNKIKPLLVGKDALEREKIMGALSGIGSSARASVDIALHDLLGKRAKLPVKSLIGGYREKIPTSVTIGIKNTSQTLEEAYKLIDQGAKVLKVKIGINPPQDVERIKRLRESIGYEVKLRVDANQGYSVNKAIGTLNKMERYEIEFVEQPVSYDDLNGLREVRKNVRMPIMADESVHTAQDLYRLIQKDAADMVNIKLMKSGGIREAIRIVNLAENAGMPCMVGCMVETKVGITAGTHLALGLKSIKYADLDGHLDLENDPTSGGVITKKGINGVTPGPGLGLRIKVFEQ